MPPARALPGVAANVRISRVSIDGPPWAVKAWSWSSIQVGGTRCTSREALRRFFGELTAAKANQPAPQVRRADSASVRQAERALAAVGI